MTHFKLHFFGQFDLEFGDAGNGRFRSITEQALLAYLVVEQGQVHRREKLAGLFWPEHPESAARRNLNQTLINLRKAVDDYDANPPVLHITRQTLQFNRESNSMVDVHQFQQALHHVQTHRHNNVAHCLDCVPHLNTMVHLYQGAFLDGFSLPASIAFEEWQLFKREQFQIQALEALANLAEHHEWQENWEQAILLANREREIDPLRESAYRRLMRFAWQNGQRSQAIAYYEMCHTILADELGIEPEPETTAVYQQIKQGKPQSTLTIQTQTSYQLPTPTTPLLGREEILTDLSQQLSQQTQRLFTLVGQGGIGKTRLSLALGAAVRDQFADGVCFVPLAKLSTPPNTAEEAMNTLLTTAVANALDFTFTETTSSIEQLYAFLSKKQVLLILDNFEHLMAGAPFVEQLLLHALQLSVLVTSRESLNLHSEYAVQLPGLPVPDSLTAAAKNASVRLFVERANRTRANFQLDEANLPTVIDICRLVDGNPLALELAAAWTRMMSSSEIAQAIQENLDFLTTSLRGVPERHQSLRAVFASSWALLPADEQQLLAQLSIFQGGAKREAITAVLGGDLFLLAGLVDKSLVHWRSTGRYELHELVRQFAAEKLQERPFTEITPIRQKHSHYYLDFVHQHTAALTSDYSHKTVAIFRAETNNIYRAWEWAVQQQNEVDLANSLFGLARFYRLTGQYQTGIDVLTMALKTGCTSDNLQAQILIHQAVFFNRLGKYNTAAKNCETAVSLAPQNPEIAANAYLYWGEALWYLGDLEAAYAHLEQALAFAKQANFPATETDCLLMMGSIHLRRGANNDAETTYTNALQLAQQTGNAVQENQALRNLGAVCRNLGRYAQAQSYYEQGLRIAHHIGHQQAEGAAHNNLGDLLLHQGLYDGAKTHFEQGLNMARLIGNRRGEAVGLNNLGIVARDVGMLDEAQVYFAQASILSKEIGYKRGTGWTQICQSLLLSQTEQFDTARKLSFDALYLFEAMQDRLGIGFASQTYGRALTGLGYFEEAADAYTQALHIRTEMGQDHLLPESWAGLADVAMQQEDTTEAVAQVEKTLDFIVQQPNLSGVYEPMRIYLICLEILHSVHDPRYDSLRETAVSQLHQRAKKIQDTQMRHSFLHNIPLHQQLLDN